ncbi:hypothetical protein [Paenarthrobacter aurescens]|uniref:Secreted protein n=1 Tax=Paenarthrobacter aurescens TaxID=43663 RepID=A0A4Y3NIL8_PAEAU|nr:hypothetical protein [Paenarthrobacter aurescens]UKA50051.1 hypothetical protein LFT48_00435 [Arthrobacter sp. FW305-123]MDO6141778.1 hypothetical protein [Paenarthrobacter aurescens]MDO6149541.1 hypothetical protein [Paenarthrobacter aurescens]MDO6156827.1 hypothetical protein [Paenarthrobacter aurescens]MDO6160813.1 hypothetical protein [Paenarthrobacter aurescens]
MISRRKVAKGAAWSLPVIAAAVAAPAASASVLPPACPGCFEPGAIPLPFTSQVIVSNKSGTLAIVSALNVDSSGCDVSLFQPAYTAIMTSATLTMSDGTTYNSTAGLGTGVGTFGSISAFNMNAIFTGINFPVGGSIVSGYPVTPTKLCVNFTMVLVGLPNLLQFQCPVTLCWDIRTTATGIVAPIPLLNSGAGTLNFTGFLSPA